MAVATQKTLVGWKAIAGYFSRDERTVMRWAASRGMPVQRVAGQARSSVYAWPDDLDAWLRRSDDVEAPTIVPEPAVAEAEAAGVVRRPARLRRLPIAIAAAVVLAALFAWAFLHAVRAPAGVAPGFRDRAAKAAYLQATFDWNLRTRDSLLRAIREYGEAIGRDPGVAVSYVGLANSYLLVREYGAMSDAEAYARAAAAANVAITLAPDAMEAHRALGFIAYWSKGDPHLAGAEFGRALALAPKDSLTHHWFATALSSNGEHAAALREIGEARMLDPTSGSTLVDFGLLSYVAGQRDQAKIVLASLAQVAPQDAALHRTLAMIALFEKHYADYFAEAGLAAGLRGDTPYRDAIARQAQGFRRNGSAGLFDVMVNEARERTVRTHMGYYQLAQALAIAGRRTAAIDALAPACTHREPDSISAPGDPFLTAAIPIATVQQMCGRGSLLAAAGRA